MVPAMIAADGVDVVRVAARDRARAEAFAAEHGLGVADDYAAIVAAEDIDAVYIPLPTSLHAHWALEALQHGKHVLSEKSLTGGYAAAAPLFSTALGNDLSLFENFMCERHPQNLEVRSLMASGALGDIREISLAFGFPPFPSDDQRNSAALEGGALNDAGAYCIDMATFYLDEYPESITMASAQLGLEVDAAGSGMMQFPSGAAAHIGFGFSHDYRNQALIWGSGGRVEIDRAFSIPSDRRPSVVLTRNTVARQLDLEPADQFQAQVNHFRDSTTDARLRRSEIARRWLHSLVMQAARDSASQRRTVRMDEYEDWSRAHELRTSVARGDSDD